MRHMKKSTGTQKRLELVRQKVRELTPQDLEKAQGGCNPCPNHSAKTWDEFAPQDN